MYRILVADDEPIERMVLEKKIKQFFPDQVEIILAENGKEAVELFESEKCQIAILDIMMPLLTGLEAAKMIKTKNRDAGIIFLTAFDEFSYAKIAIEVRALDYLLKPGKDEELISVLEEAFEIADSVAKREMKQEIIQDMTVEAEASVKRETEKNADNKGSSEESNLRMKYFEDEIREFMEAHYKEDLSLQDVAEKVGYSDAYFCKMFKQHFDKSFIMYLNDLRIEKAKALLADLCINIKDVSTEAGFREPNYFAKVFRRATGVSPREYRAKIFGEND